MLPFQLHFKHRERAIELMTTVDQVRRVVALDNAKPICHLIAQPLRLTEQRTNHGRVERWHVAVLLGSMSPINAVKLVDL